MYLTVHELERHHIERAFESLSARGLPAVRGELAGPDTPGYHYCPGRDQAVEWFGQQGLAITGEGFRRENGWGYRHFLLRTQPVNAAGSRYAAGRHTGTAGCAVSLVAAFCVRRCPSWYCTRMRAGVA